MFECLEECGANTDCSSSCYRASVVCNDACPCHAGKKLLDFKNSEATTLLFQIVHLAANNARTQFANHNWL